LKPVTFQVCNPGCSENWQCSAWGTCTNNQQTRTCTDSSNCGTELNMPAQTQACGTACTESWTCGDWGACQSTNLRSRSCVDSNSCGTTASKPIVLEDCTYTSGSGSSGGGGGGGGGSRGGASGGPSLATGGPSTSRTWSVIEPGEYDIEVVKAGVDITGVSFEMLATRSSARMAFTALDNRPAAVPELENLYKYFEITKTNIGDADLKGNIIVMFRVAKSWISENGFDPEKIFFNRYAGGTWNRLQTDLVDEDESYHYYEASTPGFSYFAITAEKEEEESQVAEAKETVTQLDGAAPSKETDLTAEPELGNQETGLEGTGAVIADTTRSDGPNIIGIVVIVAIIAGLVILLNKMSK
jgi:PGF-pre-PGF domain-containing protein